MTAIEAYENSREILAQKFELDLESKFVNTDGPVKRVHYLEAGSGLPMIMIHGGGSHSGEWLNIVKPLSKRFHLYIVDRPGCGLTDPINYSGVDLANSATEFIRSFMDALRLKKAFLTGQSMGGFFSICFAMKYPQRVEKLILVGAPAGMNRWLPPFLRMLGIKWLNRFLSRTIAKPSFKNTRKVHEQLLVAHPDRLSDEYLRFSYHSQLLPGARNGFLSLLENITTPKGWRKDQYIGNKLHQLTVPARFIWGEKDAFESPQTGREKTAVIADCKFEIVEDAGHSPWLDQPKKCAALIIAMSES